MNSSEADNQNNKRAGDLGLSALISDELRSIITDSNCSDKPEESKGPTQTHGGKNISGTFDKCEDKHYINRFAQITNKGALGCNFIQYGHVDELYKAKCTATCATGCHLIKLSLKSFDKIRERNWKKK